MVIILLAILVILIVPATLEGKRDYINSVDRASLVV